MAMNAKKRTTLTQEIQQNVKKDNLKAMHAHIENKHRYTNLERHLNKQRLESELQAELQHKQQNEADKERNLCYERSLARELDAIKREDIVEMRLRQQLRCNCPELRELERKLKAAYINKELAAQIAQKEAERLNVKISTKLTNDQLKEAWMDEEAKKKQLRQEEILKKAQYKQELQDQIILREKAKRNLYEELLIEKKLIDDIVQRIHDEDERALQEKMCKMNKMWQEMEGFRKAQEFWKKKKHEQIEEENRKIQEFLDSKDADVKQRSLEKAKREAAKAALSEKIAKEIYAKKAKEKEREDIIQELLEEEERETVEKRHRDEVEQMLRRRIETRDSLLKQMHERQEKQKQDALDEKQLRAELLEKMANDQKLDQLSDQKRRMKMLQLRRDIEDMMKERRQKHAEEMQLLLRLEEQAKAEAELRRKIVEEERHRMLKDHVKNLIGYLPKGILSVDDLPYLDKEVLAEVSPNFTKTD